MSSEERQFMQTMSQQFKPLHDWRQATGRGVTVAVIDSGIDTRHQELSGRVIESVEARIAGNRVIFEPSTAGDSAGHGTACAAIAARIAPHANFASIKVLGAGGLGDAQAFLAGLEYAIKKRYKVINLSLGTTKPQFFAPLHDMLDRAYQAGCVVVAAANNLPQPSFPSVFSSSLISVIKSAETDPLKFGFHYGEVIELTAPGVNIRTAWLDNGYKTLTGNSFACPHISGIVARIVEGYPDLTPFQVKTALYAIARDNAQSTDAAE
ncbi:MAG: S8 family serine peptidase [Chloracidobacterium sp.]|nr:S8 family serine peptidase [Chloracidobacterium sp.]MCO5334041.1 S8 family serine peptidase [Pyrinomonadaceae bacterium]